MLKNRIRELDDSTRLARIQLIVPTGTAFAQGIFLPFGITVDDDARGVRNGGLGSTTSR